MLLANPERARLRLVQSAEAVFFPGKAMPIRINQPRI